MWRLLQKCFCWFYSQDQCQHSGSQNLLETGTYSISYENCSIYQNIWKLYISRIAINKISKNAFSKFIFLTAIACKMYIFIIHTFMVNWLANCEPMFEDKWELDLSRYYVLQGILLYVNGSSKIQNIRKQRRKKYQFSNWNG